MLRTRLLIGGCLIAATVGMVFADAAIGFPGLGVVTVVAAIVLAQRELHGLLRGATSPALSIVQGATIATTVWLVLHRYGGGGAGGLIAVCAFGFALGTIATLVQATVRYQKSPDNGEAILHDAVAAGFGWAYVAFPMLLFAVFMLSAPEGTGTKTGAFLVLISKAGDMGGYLVGTFFGRRRVMPNVSPKKSYEGSFAGLLLTVAFAFGLRELDSAGLGRLDFVATLLLAIVVNLATQAGDFAESMIKRACRQKDSANLLPTFGGSLDIIDSLVFALPVAFVVLVLMA